MAPGFTACNRILFSTGLLAWLSVSAMAESPIPTNLTLASAVDLALRDNPQLKRLRTRWEAMRERPAQAGALPNPMFTYSGMDRSDGGDWPDTNEKRYMVQQEFPWFGKRGLREGIAVKEAEIVRRELDAMTRDIVMSVKESVFDLVAIQKVIAITREEEEVIHRIVTIAEAFYATGTRTQADVLKAQAEVTMLKQKLLELLAQESALKSKLNTLLNRRADRPLSVSGALPESAIMGELETLFALAATNRPEIMAAQAEIERYDLETRLMEKESAPDYKLGLEYREIGEEDDMVMVSVSVELPVWRSKVRAGVREAEHMRASSQAARETAERQSVLEVQDTSFKLQTARRTLELYRAELIPQAEARFNASEAGYRTGKVDFMDLLESERFLLTARTMAAMAEGAVGTQAARLERAIGTDLGNGLVGAGSN